MKLQILFSVRDYEDVFVGFREADSVEKLQRSFLLNGFLSVFNADRSSFINYSLDQIRCYTITEIEKSDRLSGKENSVISNLMDRDFKDPDVTTLNQCKLSSMLKDGDVIKFNNDVSAIELVEGLTVQKLIVLQCNTEYKVRIDRQGKDILLTRDDRQYYVSSDTIDTFGELVSGELNFLN